MEPGLELRGLCCLRGRREVLHISHLQIPKGAIVAVVGRNGAGKSTLLLTLGGLLRFRGTVRVGGEPAAPKALSRLSYLVMQEAGHQLFSDTVPGELTLNNPNSTEQDAREILAALGLAIPDLFPVGRSSGCPWVSPWPAVAGSCSTMSPPAARTEKICCAHSGSRRIRSATSG